MFRKNLINVAIVFAFVIGLFSPNTNQTVQAQENQVGASQSDSNERPTNRIIIKYKDGTPASFTPSVPSQMQRVNATSNSSFEYVREMSNEAHVLEMSEPLPVEQVEAITTQLETLPEVEYAEPDRIYQHTLIPNDSEYAGNQWNLFGTWGINAPTAWDSETGSTDVVIAVVDTGITTHGDINNRLVAGYDFISFDGEANDDVDNSNVNERDNDPSDPGNWITADESASGYFQGCQITDSTWHGTHVAGIIGAETNNNAGIAGVDWNARILPIRVLGKCGGYTSDIVDGMRWAAGLAVSGVPNNPVANHADIINLSLGGSGSCSTTEQTAITEIVNAGVVVVAAAGNTDTNVSNFSPANCTGVIAVAATTSTGQKASYSNFGAIVDISAPGDDIFSLIDSGTTIPAGEDYWDKSGTSMAAPQVSGVLGLMFAINPDLTPAQALTILQNTAKDFPGGGTCTTSNCGAGIVDAAAAVALTSLPDLIITNVTLNPAQPTSGQSFQILVTVKNQGGSGSGSIVYRDVWVDVDPSTLPDNDLDGCPDTDSNYFRQDFNNSLPPGASETLPVEVPGGLTGSHQLWVYVDATCITAEGIEDNNIYTPIIIGDGADIEVTIGGVLKGTYPLENGENEVVSYIGTNGGPVVVSSTNGSNIIASLLQFRRPGTTGEWTDMTQTMALTDAQISDAYVFPRYDFSDPKKYNSIQLANFDSISTDISVTIGGVLRGTYTIGVGGSQNVTFPNVTGGPVVIRSSNGARIIASLYELKRTAATGLYTGQTQMMGLPEAQLSTTYVIPRYNYTLQDVIPYLVFANAGSTPTTVTVTIGGVVRGTYNMASGQSRVETYSGVNGGPVVVSSNNGVNIIASLLQFRRPGNSGEWTGMTQTMALTDAQISDAYVFPRYDFSDPKKYNSIQLANFDSISTDISVTIGGVLQGTYTIGVGASQNVTFPNVTGGPVVIRSSNGARIIASLYELKRTAATGLYTGQTQMMGLPESQLSSTYVIPRYNYTLQDVIPYVIFGLP